MSNLILRLFSTIIIIPIFVYLVYLNNLFFNFFLLALYFISFYELKFLIKKKIKFFFWLQILIIIFLYSFLKLRGDTFYDFVYLFWIISIVWLSDIGGYVFGKIFGGVKLCKWSPNKTVSGFLGSIIFSQFSIIILVIYLPNFVITNAHFIMQFFLCLISVFGDLFFSYLKRNFDIKDYSKLIPGHGGLLDRIDGLIFVVIVSFLLKLFIVL